jgi:hypothetical protein
LSFPPTFTQIRPTGEFKPVIPDEFTEDGQDPESSDVKSRFYFNEYFAPLREAYHHFNHLISSS